MKGSLRSARRLVRGTGLVGLCLPACGWEKALSL